MEDRQSKPSRYEIRKLEASDHIKRLYPDLAGPLFTVWDLERNKRVPFGNYRDRSHAERRIKRLEARDAG